MRRLAWGGSTHEQGIARRGALLGVLLWCWIGGETSAVAEERTSSLAPGEPAVELQDPGLLPAELFLAPPRIRLVRLSPAGDRLAYLLREEQGSTLWLADLEEQRHQQLLHSNQVQDLHWSSDGSGVFLEAEERVAWLPIEAAVAGQPEPRASFVIHLDREREQALFGVDPRRPRHLLITEKQILRPEDLAESGAEHQNVGEDQSSGEQTVYRLLSVSSRGTQSTLYESHQLIRSFLLDEAGELSFVTGVEGSDHVIYRLRRAGSGQPEAEIVLRCDPYDACQPLGLAGDPGREQLQVLSHWGVDRRRLLVLDLATGQGDTRHQDPLAIADLAEVLVDPTLGQPVLARYDTDRRRYYGLEEQAAGHLRRVEELLPGANYVLHPRSRGPYWLVVQRDAKHQHPRYHLYSTRTGELRPVLEAQRQRVPALPSELLGEKRFFSYRASDGMLLHAFVTLPPRVDPRRAPVVALIHGGPWNHVRPGFDTIAQFLANRGYVVFEPNFRASTGYGRSYLLAGKGEFGDGRVHRDIMDGLDYLADEGLGDPQRVAIYGHSFGGFSTLGALAFEPQRFRAGIASAPPIDLVRSLLDLGEEHDLPSGLKLAEVMAELLVDLDDHEAVAEMRRRMPEVRLADTERPLLMLAGARDQKVDIVEVRHYAAALHGLGKDVSLLVDEDSGHSFRSRRLRLSVFHLLERFLAYHLEQPFRAPAEETEEAVVSFLEHNLLLRGPSLERALAAFDQQF